MKHWAKIRKIRSQGVKRRLYILYFSIGNIQILLILCRENACFSRGKFVRTWKGLEVREGPNYQTAEIGLFMKAFRRKWFLTEKLICDSETSCLGIFLFD